MALYFFIIPTFYVRGILGSFPEGRPSVRLSVTLCTPAAGDI